MDKNRNLIEKIIVIFVAVLLVFAVSKAATSTNSLATNNSPSENTKAPINKWCGDKQDPTTIILVRHGETNYNLEGRYQGRLDIPLNDTGLAQADKLADYLKNTPIDVVITSPLKRAEVTGEKVANTHGLSLSTDERLMEIDFGDWAGNLKKDLKVEFPDEYKTWEETPWLFQMPNGESLEMMGTRGAQALKDIALENAGKTVLIAAHSMFNQAVMCELYGLGYEHFNQLGQDNTSISVLRYDGKWKILMWNAIPHLDMVANGLPLNAN